MSGVAYACHIRHREMVKARSEAAKQRAKLGEKNAAFRDGDSQ